MGFYEDIGPQKTRQGDEEFIMTKETSVEHKGKIIWL